MPAAAYYPATISCLHFRVVDFASSGSHYDKGCSRASQADLKRLQRQGRKGRSEPAGTVHFRLLRLKCVRRLQHQGQTIVIRCTAGTSDSTFLPRELNDVEQQVWQRSCESVIYLGFSSAEADSMVARAFGWKKSSYWGEARVPSVPDPEAIRAVLGYLKELGMTDPDVAKVVKKLPEVLGLLVEEDMKKNVATLEQTWGISGNMLKNLLLRTPGALGFTIDCKGDCQGLCTRCWARL